MSENSKVEHEGCGGHFVDVQIGGTGIATGWAKMCDKCHHSPDVDWVKDVVDKNPPISK